MRASRAMPSRLVVVVAHARSGSTLLTQSMSQHPSLEMFGELFTESRAERVLAARWAWPYRDGDDPVDYLKSLIDRWGHPPTRMVGFKLMYGHATRQPAAAVWSRLAEDPDVTIVHLRRCDALASLTSLLVAERTNVWALPAGGEPPPAVPAFRISPDECDEHFRWLSDRGRWVDRRFARHRKLDLCYETQIALDYPETLAALWRFLGVRAWPCHAELSKQARTGPADQIANYAELRRHFTGTPWERYFVAVDRSESLP